MAVVSSVKPLAGLKLLRVPLSTVTSVVSKLTVSVKSKVIVEVPFFKIFCGWFPYWRYTH